MAIDVGGDDEGGVKDINITPLLDVLIVLLAISLVTGAALAPGLLSVTLPSSGGAEMTPGGGPITVTIDESAGMAVEGVLTTAERLEDDLRAALVARGANEVLVAGDKRAVLEYAVLAIECARRAGAERASLATAKAGGR